MWISSLRVYISALITHVNRVISVHSKYSWFWQSLFSVVWMNIIFKTGKDNCKRNIVFTVAFIILLLLFLSSTLAVPRLSSATGQRAVRLSRSSRTSFLDAVFTPWTCPTGKLLHPVHLTAGPSYPEQKNNWLHNIDGRNPTVHGITFSLVAHVISPCVYICRDLFSMRYAMMARTVRCVAEVWIRMMMMVED